MAPNPLMSKVETIESIRTLVDREKELKKQHQELDYARYELEMAHSVRIEINIRTQRIGPFQNVISSQLKVDLLEKNDILPILKTKLINIEEELDKTTEKINSR